MIKFRSGIILLMFICIWGCSSANDSSMVLDASGKHPAGWVVASNGGNHPAVYLAAPDICKECHGGDLKGGISKVSCFSADRGGMSCHAQGPSGHPAGWSDPAAHGAHAKAAPSGADGMAFCTNCHGTDFRGGGVSQKDCLRCHATAPHPAAANWRSTGTITHTTTAPNNAKVCAPCHNSLSPNLAAPNLTRFANAPAGSFNGSSPDCFNASMCHGDVRKTGNCDACHSTATTSPFNSMAGATSPSDSKVGAHVKHLSAFAQTAAHSDNIVCTECHVVPVSAAVSGTHRNGSNDIVFGLLAKTGSLMPTYTAATGVCANTYCHGTTLTGGTNKSPVWNQSDYLNAAGCGTCHGFPPATTTHSGVTPALCITCHSHVNATGTGFTDQRKHVNGVIDAAGGHTFPFGGSVHRPGGSGSTLADSKAPFSRCSGCHDTITSGGTYPVASGAKPLCSACHLYMNNFTGISPGCWDCHGSSASSGMPNGTTFPNLAGRHNDHSGITCDVCHYGGGTGTPTHGSSNHLFKTANNVVVAFSTAGGTMSATRSYNSGTNILSVTCTGLCHEQHNGRRW